VLSDLTRQSISIPCYIIPARSIGTGNASGVTEYLYAIDTKCIPSNGFCYVHPGHANMGDPNGLYYPWQCYYMPLMWHRNQKMGVDTRRALCRPAADGTNIYVSSRKSINIYDLTRSRYSPVRVSTFTLSPWFTKSGTFISTPFSVVAYFKAPEEVSPLTAGSA
jgi:hypothetical protein